MLRLNINQQYAQIGLNIKEPQIKLQSTLPRVEIQTNPAVLQIESPGPVLHIDQTQCFAESGLKNNAALREDLVSRARSNILEDIAAIASEGDQLAKIRGATIGTVIANRCPKSREFTMVSMPQSRPQISFETSLPTINYRPAVLDFNLNEGQVDSNLDWGKVDLYLQQKNSIKMYCTEAQLITFA